ncbi:hypothetical protein IFR05_010257 [Cadophora sp. M221]|nr:hypothetical protein IFR05_010257 [Cadophora sp. M221]
MAISFSLMILSMLAALVLSGCGVAAYRLYFGPLSQFPGPKLAALTGWYETYFDCWKKGRYWVEIEEMHKQYGPIVRISPWELHVDDPDWNEPYKISSRVDKYHWYYKFVGSSDAAFGTADHDLHRVRRKAQQGYFTQEAVANFDGQLKSICNKLQSRLEEFKGTGQPVNLSNAFRSLATDVVTEYCFHKSYDLLDEPDFAASFQRAIRDFPEIGTWHRHFGLILDIFAAMPRWLVAFIDPAGVSVLDFFNDIVSSTNSIVGSYNTSNPKLEKPNAIHRMLESPDFISTSVAGRLPRINNREAIKYDNYSIPAGTPVSMTQKLIHNNPSIFPDPRKFQPERWTNPTERKNLEKYLQPFGRGSRACLGIQTNLTPPSLAQQARHRSSSPAIHQPDMNKQKHLTRRQTQVLNQAKLQKEKTFQAQGAQEDHVTQNQLPSQDDPSTEHEETNEERLRREEATRKRAKSAANKSTKRQYQHPSHDAWRKSGQNDRFYGTHSTRGNSGMSHRAPGSVWKQNKSDAADTYYYLAE